MTDVQDIEIGIARPRFELAKGLTEDLQNNLKENGAVTVDELFNIVIKWEKEHETKLSDEEFEILTIPSLVLSTSKKFLEKTVGPDVTNEDKEKTYLQSIETQQLILQTVFANLDKDGKPNKTVVMSLSLVSKIFDEYFSYEKPKLSDLGIETQTGLWQGVQGMVTTAILFHEAGWKVGIPKDKELDMRYDVDLVVTAPNGDIYAVDITARIPREIDDVGTLSRPFFVEQARLPSKVLEDKLPGIKGYLKVNVPPMIHHSSNEFYEDKLAGYPSKSAFGEFKGVVNKFS